MIQAQDLRLGNLLRHKNGEICTVALLSYGRNIGLSEICIDSNDELQPIPLTEQILLDSKFKHTKGSAIVIFEKDDFSVEIRLNAEYAEIMFYFKGKQIPCKSTIYVHDLQNAFYIATGENLNIVIK